MSRYIDADLLELPYYAYCEDVTECYRALNELPSIDIVRCSKCKKSHIDGKTTHYLWCTEWGRSTDTFGYCERGEREGE